MRRRFGVIGAAVAGAIAGGLIMLSLPTAGREAGPTPAPQVSAHTIGQPPVTTLLAWTPGRLPDGLADSVQTIDGVESVAEVRSGIAWLSGWADQEQRETSAPPGLQIPMEVAAIDPAKYAGFVPPGDRTKIYELDRGSALLGTTGAGARDIELRGHLRMGGSGFEVAGVIDDGLIGAHEAVVSNESGEALGIVTPRYLLIALAPDADRSRIEDRIRATLPPGTRVRVRAPGETPLFRHGDAVLAMAQVKQIFGEFAAQPMPDGTVRVDPNWVEANIVTVPAPLLGQLQCHRAVTAQMTAALEEISRRGLGNLVRADDFGGCFSPRFLNRDPAAGLSHHSWGIALDINVSDNGFGSEPAMDPRVVEILQRWGMTWGGQWLVPDGMHFEFLRWPLGAKG